MRRVWLGFVGGGQLLVQLESGAPEDRLVLEFALRVAEREAGGARRGPFPMPGDPARVEASLHGTTAMAEESVRRVLEQGGITVLPLADRPRESEPPAAIRPVAPTSEGARAAGDGSRGSVLIVDDDRELRESLMGLMESEGYGVVSAANGKEALDALGRTNPSVILLDLRMPVMTGAEFLARMRSNPRYDELPVIVMTATESYPENLGAVALLRKPLDVDRVIEVVDRHCGHG